MPTSVAQFNADLYLEHLSEASFLYSQQRAYRDDPEVDWPALHEWEDRFEAHLDALLVGREAALAVCQARAAEGDPGELHTVLRLLCRYDRPHDAFTLIGALDPGNTEAGLAAAQALCADMPAAWRDLLVAEFQRQPQARAVYARVAGYRRVACEPALLDLLQDGTAHGQAELAWALGRIGTTASVRPLRALLAANDSRTVDAAAVSLVRLGDGWPVGEALRMRASAAWMQRVLGIAGSASALPVLLDVLAGEAPAPDAARALGQLGDLTAVGPLLDALERKALAAAAAVALNTITGAQLQAKTFVPYTFDRDELNEDERAAFDRDGSVPTRAGEPFGQWERLPLLDRAGWHGWLERHKHRFQRGVRWRMGLPYGPAALVACLEAETTPYDIRSGAYDELVARYRLEVPFEPDLAVPRQRRSLARVEQWSAQHAATYTAGLWYLAGERQA